MKIHILTLFPETLLPILNSSIVGRAQKKGLVEFDLINIRDFGQTNHKTVDDRPYGGGIGMVLKPDVLANALKSIRSSSPNPKVILTSAAGKPFTQIEAKQLSKLKELVIICGHYEGVDERFVQNYVDEEISIGDYVLTGGEIAGLVIIDSLTRLIKGVLPEGAIDEESFTLPGLEYPHYTRPEVFEGISVPQVLLGGNHKEIKKWRLNESVKKTLKNRPDLV